MRVQHPFAVHHKNVTVMTMTQRQLGRPVAILPTNHRVITLIIPTIKITNQTDAFGLRSDAHKMNRFRISMR